MSNGRNAGAAAGGGAIYGLGIFGALVYFWQQANGLGEHLLAVIQGLFWPAFMVYEASRHSAAAGEGRVLHQTAVGPAETARRHKSRR
jgi:hypothetical protein